MLVTLETYRLMQMVLRGSVSKMKSFHLLVHTLSMAGHVWCTKRRMIWDLVVLKTRLKQVVLEAELVVELLEEQWPSR